jgi:1-deoxy-D-xylulose-5-phosphate reductoisomerase
MVEYLDGSVLAQLSNPDMRTPIAHSLAYPERVEAGVQLAGPGQDRHSDLRSPGSASRFPAWAWPIRPWPRRGRAAILNAANEEVVAAFLDHRIPYLAIAATLDRVLQRLAGQPANSLEDLTAADAAARRVARELIVSESVGQA